MQRHAEQCWQADMGTQPARALDLLQRRPAPIPAGHQHLVSHQTGAMAAAELAHHHDLSLDLDVEDVFDPLMALGKLATWVGGRLYGSDRSLPHRQEALRNKTEQVTAANDSLERQQAAVRPELAERMRFLVRSHDDELAELGRRRHLLPHRRGALRREVDEVRRKREFRGRTTTVNDARRRARADRARAEPGARGVSVPAVKPTCRCRCT